jgi:hypothetical protein
MLGLPNDVRLIDHVDRSRVDSIIDSALRLFYYPNPSQFTIADATEAQKERLKRAPHQWSFLQKSYSLSITSGTAIYDLPADFSNFLDEPISADGRIAIVTAAHLRQLLSSATASGDPKYIAVEAKSHDGTSSQRMEAILFPVPDANTTINVRYGVAATGLSSTKQYPHGGQEHADVAQHSSEGVWPVDEPDDGLGINRQYLGRLIGRELGYGPNRHTWTHQQSEMVKECTKQGLRRFYNPPVLPGERYPHSWSFLQPLATLTTVSGEHVVQMPVGFTMLDGDMTYQEDQSLALPIVRYVGEEMVRKNHSRMDAFTGHPQLVAIRRSNAEDTAGTRYEAVFWPVPDGAYVLEYRYRMDPVMLAMSENVAVPGMVTDLGGGSATVVTPGRVVVDGSSVPEGGQAHHQTLIESCLLACDEMMKRNSQQRAERFRELLYASVGFDRQVNAPMSIGYNGDDSDRTYTRDYRDLHSNIITYGGSH